MPARRSHAQVLPEVLANPFKVCSAKDLAQCVRKSTNWVLAAKSAGAPMHRPEWFMEWLKEHPEFTYKEHKAAILRTVVE